MGYSYSWKDVFSPGKAEDFFSKEGPGPFDVTSSNFSPTNAWWLSELSRLIYYRGTGDMDPVSQTAARNSFLQAVGLEERWFYDGRYLQCSIIGPLPDLGSSFSVLVFRGTRMAFTSWFYNFEFILSPWSTGGHVHRGFKLVLLDAWEEIRKALEQVLEPVFFTGHSLGGALAVLAATLHRPEAVYTFGAPRMANSAFVKQSRQVKIFRVVNPKDIVPTVPPIPGILSVGEEHSLSGSEAFGGYRSWRDAPVFLADHSPSNYSLQFQ